MRAKLLLFICITGIASTANAQQFTSFKQEADSVFKHLNKKNINTGILYDRVYPSAMLNAFNSTVFDTTNARHFKQAYHELYEAAYDPANLVKPAVVNRRAMSVLRSGIVPVGIINFTFNQVDTNAVSDNLLEDRNGIFYDVPLRRRSPYWNKRVSIISPLVDSTEGLQVTFQTSRDLYLNNTARAVISLKADFDNGNGPVNIGVNNSITVNYPSLGQKIIKFIIRYDDNRKVITYANLKLVKKKSFISRSFAGTCDRDDTVSATIPFTDYDNNSFRGRGNIHYYFSTATPCNGLVKKPIIILDGFDPGDQRSISQLYDVYLNNPDRYKFGDEMRARGYDIVVLNFPGYINEYGQQVDGGADYIERNAFVLVSLINEMNRQLAVNESKEKLVIIGPSMGGMISRYALAYMEKNNMDHNTRLWVSLDAPHNGANVPIGAQKYIEFFANNGNQGALETLQRQLNNPAAKQQLLHHYLSYSDEAKGAPGFRDRFALALEKNGVPGSDGFPLIPRKVALVDGSLDGTLQPNSSACQEALNSKSYLKINLFLFKVKLFRIAQASIYLSGSYHNPCTVLSASQLFKGSVDARGYAPPSSISYDIAPGGSRASFTTLADEGAGYSAFFQFLIELGSSTEFNVYNGSHSFIPTKSALAFKGTNQDLAENVYRRNLTCTGETPFDTYYGSTKNLEHSYIDPAMAFFTIAEISGTHSAPSYSHSDSSLYISGPGTFCVPGALYSLQGGSVPPGTSLSWSVTPAIATIAAGEDSTSVILSRVSNGTGTLSVQLTGTCGLNQQLTKPFSIEGSGIAVQTVYGPSYACNEQYAFFTTTNVPGATSYNWVWPTSWTYIAGQGTSKLTLQSGDSSGTVSVNIANACNTEGIPAKKYVQVNPCNLVMNTFPNPVISNVTISTGSVLSFKSTFVTAEKFYKLRVTDIFGNIKIESSYSRGQNNIPLHLGGLVNGTYIIHGYDGKVWMNKIVVVAH